MSVNPPIFSHERSAMSNGDSDSLRESDSDHQNGIRIAQNMLKKYKSKTHTHNHERTPRKSPSYYVEDERRSSSEERHRGRRGEKYRRKEERYHGKNSPEDVVEGSHEHLEAKYSGHQELYCQKSSSSSTSSWEDNSFNYIGGTMYPKPSEGGELGRLLPSSSGTGPPFGWSVRLPVCRPRFWKFLLLVVILLMMAQFSLNILFYRNYDSLFYVNVTSAESLASFESRVRWVSSKLPWVHSTTVKPVTVIPLHNPASGSSAPLMIGERIANLMPEDIGEKTILQHKVEALVREKEMQLKNAAMPVDKIPDEGGGNGENVSSLHSRPSKSSPVSGVAQKATSKTPRPARVVKPTQNATVHATPSKIMENNNGKGRLPYVSQMASSLEPSNNSSTLNGSRETKRVLLSKEKPLCPPVPPKLVGSVKIYRSVPTLEEQERGHPELEPGGRFRPADCRARHRVAIIVPYRDRVKHLAMFIYHIHPILQRQQIDYAIYIVEQAGSGKFNRAMLLNVGALEALKQYRYDCFIFHDVDLLPEDDRNLYTCPEQPRHMSIAIDSMSYKLPYNDIFGGVSGMTVDQFKTVNGFSNKFWGWGGEDDDMSNRIKFYGFFISRYPANIGRYTMLSHRKDEPNPRRYQYLYDGKKRFKSDGLNSAKYRAIDVQLRRLYTWVYVDLYPS